MEARDGKANRLPHAFDDAPSDTQERMRKGSILQTDVFWMKKLTKGPSFLITERRWEDNICRSQ